MNIEPLETRIAPAMATLQIINPATATYTDVDGDKVTVKVSTGTLTAGLFTGVAGASGDQLQLLDLSGGGFDTASVTFTVARVPGGDGLANVGAINSTGHDLGKVTVKGDLGQIDAGDATTATPGLKALSVRSLGRLGTDTQAAGGSLRSDIVGALGSLAIAGDVKEAFVNVTGGAGGRIGAIIIGGSLIGGASASSGKILSSAGGLGFVKIGRDVQGGSGADSGLIDTSGDLAGISVGGSVIGGSGDASGSIFSTGDMGLVKIGHDVQGGAGTASGLITPNGKLAGITIGGSLLGGANANSGEIFSIGDMGAVKIGHDVKGGAGTSSGFIHTDSKLAGVTIGGSLIGGSAFASGKLFSGDNMGAVKIGHDVQGGSAADSGLVDTSGNLAGVTVGGSVIGGSANSSGSIYSGGDMGVVKIGHNVQGGSGDASGLITPNGRLVAITIGGSLIGGSNTNSGQLYSLGDMGPVKIGHDVKGGSISGATATLDGTGLIHSDHRIASVFIGGSIIAGIDDSNAGSLTRNASIRAGDDIGSLTVKGGLIGNTTANGASPVVISARGQLVQGATTDLAIGRISIGGRVELANLLAGFNTGLVAVNGDAQIGAVKVGGDWVASNLVTGAMNLGADDAVGGTGADADNVNFGDTHDALIAAGNASILAKIASITIAGHVFGTPASASATDHFGFVAEQIVSVKAGGAAIPLTPNAHNDNRAIGATGDVTIHEI